MSTIITPEVIDELERQQIEWQKGVVQEISSGQHVVGVITFLMWLRKAADPKPAAKASPANKAKAIEQVFDTYLESQSAKDARVRLACMTLKRRVQAALSGQVDEQE